MNSKPHSYSINIYCNYINLEQIYLCDINKLVIKRIINIAKTNYLFLLTSIFNDLFTLNF